MYDLELDMVTKEINARGAKHVCIQLPDGLKPRADEIVRHIRRTTSADVIIWAGSCFGACDVPLQAKRLGCDLLLQWGHAAWK